MKTEISICIGLGDNIVIRGYLDTIKSKYEEIRISHHKPIIQNYRNNDPEYTKFLDQIGNLLFSEPPYIFDHGDYPHKSQFEIMQHFQIDPQKPNLSHLLCKGINLNISEPYIVITTKVRIMRQEIFFPLSIDLWKTLRKLSEKYKIVIMGEKVVEYGKEYLERENVNNGIYSIYEQIISNLPQDRIIDLTVPALGITTPSLEKIQQDCLIMNQAKFVIVIGVGGNFCLSSAVANTIGFREDKEPHLDKVLAHNYSDLFMTREWLQFMKKINCYL